MKIVDFEETNIVFAENQPEYQRLPACRDVEGTVLTCWRLSFWERIKLIFTGRIWCMQLTFNRPLQPQLLQVEKPVLTLEMKDQQCS